MERRYRIRLEELLDDAERGEDGRLRSVDFDWIREGNRKIKSWDNTIVGHIKISEGRLIAELNSENRAKRLRKEIEKRLGSQAVHENTLARTLEEMQRSLPHQEAADTEARDAEFEAMLRDPEVREQLQATVQKQVGRTPIEAVRDPDGREMVEALLLQWERHDERDISANQIRPDIGAIRRLLNLASPVS